MDASADVTAPGFRYDDRGWTLAVRKRTANRFVRVDDLDVTWEQAGDLAGEVARRHPELQVYYVSNVRAEGDGRVCEDDLGNILVDSGKRVRIVEGGKLADLIDETADEQGPAPADVEQSTVERFWTVADGEAIEVELIEEGYGRGDVVRTVGRGVGDEWVTLNPLGNTAVEALAHAGLL